MPVFVVERYIPRLTAEGVEAQVHAEEALASAAGVVRHPLEDPPFTASQILSDSPASRAYATPPAQLI